MISTAIQYVIRNKPPSHLLTTDRSSLFDSQSQTGVGASLLPSNMTLLPTFSCAVLASCVHSNTSNGWFALPTDARLYQNRNQICTTSIHFMGISWSHISFPPTSQFRAIQHLYSVYVNDVYIKYTVDLKLHMFLQLTNYTSTISIQSESTTKKSVHQPLPMAL